MANWILQLLIAATPSNERCETVIRAAMDLSPDSRWTIGYPTIKKNPGTRPFSSTALAECLESAPLVQDGVALSAIGISTEDERLFATLERVDFTRAKPTFLRKAGVRLSSLNLFFESDKIDEAYVRFFEFAIKPLNAIYGRVFCPAKAAKRKFGWLDVLGGIPGLHPLNYFGAPIASCLNFNAVGSDTATVIVRDDGTLLRFHSDDELSVSDASYFQSLLGAEFFRDFEGTRRESRSFLAWAFQAGKGVEEFANDRCVFAPERLGITLENT